MDARRFGPASPGRLVPIGIRGAETSFVPNPLPPNWDWPPELWPLLRDAHAALARLDGIGAYLPDPELLLRPLQRREAQTSSRLEGTYARPVQVLLFELEPGEPVGDAAATMASREVANYARALRFRRDPEESLPLSLRLIRLLHATLLDGVRGSDRTPGEFRKHVVQIGRPARFVPPSPTELAPALDAFEKYLHAKRSFDPLVEAFLVHYQFETIHPFLDGNGRVGRLLLAVCVAEWCGLSRPWLHMSPYFERNKDLYFERLFEVSASNDWSGWVEFCLKGVVEEANDAAFRCRKLIELRDRFQRMIPDGRSKARLQRIVAELLRSPALTVGAAARLTAVTYPTAKTDLETLIELGILNELPDMPRRTFYAPELVELIFDE